MTLVEGMDIKFGYTCNNNCIHCVVAGHVDRLHKQGESIDRSTEEIKSHINDAKNMGSGRVVFTGGEVTIRKDFLELLEFANKSHLQVSLQTNGRMFCSRNFAMKTLEKAPRMHFEIALHSNQSEIHDRITRVQNSFDQTMRGINNLLELGAISLNLKMVLSRLNYGNISDMVRLADSMGIRILDVSFPHGMGNALKYWSEIVPKYSEISDSVVDAYILAKNLGIKVTYEAIPFCFFKGHIFDNVESGYLISYLEDRTTLLRQVGDHEMDWQKRRLAIKAKPIKCRKCRLFNFCEGPWKEYIQFYGAGEFTPLLGDQVSSAKEFLSLIEH